MSDETKQQMPKWWSYLKWGFLAFIVLVIVKIFWVLTGQPKPTVNYLKILNEQSKPADYNDQLNAAFDLQWAASRYVDMPRSLENSKIEDWPGDLDPNQLKELETWLDKNRPALELFNKAAQKPYCWFERTAPENNIERVHWDDLNPTRHLTKMACLKAQDLAIHGDCNSAFMQLLACYRLGQVRRGKCASIVEQLVAISIKSEAMARSFEILDRSPVATRPLADFQTKLEQLHQQDCYEIDFSNEKIVFSDLIQRSFVYNSHGRGRIAFSKLKSLIADNGLGDLENPSKALSLIYIGQCFTGPTSVQMKKILDDRIACIEQIRDLSPYDLHLKNPDFFRDVERQNEGVFLLHYLGVSDHFRNVQFRSKAGAEALITTLGILRFKADTGRLPANLDEALAKGYIHFIPRDPFGPGPLTYKPQGDTFTLYSFGENFIDDGGTGAKGSGRSFQSGPDLVFWPVKPPQKLSNPPHRPVKTRP
jgi:hypothetical protein